MAQTFSVINKDTGGLSLAEADATIPAVGMKLQIEGEKTARVITFLAQSKKGTPSRHLYFKKQGPVPMGVVSYSWVK